MFPWLRRAKGSSYCDRAARAGGRALSGGGSRGKEGRLFQYDLKGGIWRGMSVRGLQQSLQYASGGIAKLFEHHEMGCVGDF